MRGVFGSEGRRSRSDKKTQESLPTFLVVQKAVSQRTDAAGTSSSRSPRVCSHQSARPPLACQPLHFFAEGLSLPTGPVLPTPALSASPLGHSHAESRHAGLFTPAPQSSRRGLSPSHPPPTPRRGERPDNTLGLASPGSWLWSLGLLPSPPQPANESHSRKSIARFYFWGPRIEHLGLQGSGLDSLCSVLITRVP